MTFQDRFGGGAPGGRRDITPPEVFHGRRRFMGAALGVLAAPVGCTNGAQDGDEVIVDGADPRVTPPVAWPEGMTPPKRADYALPGMVPSRLTPRLTAATHNNFYEFLPGRGGPVWKYTDEFTVDPWKVEITGACRKPATVDLDDLNAMELEERLYHFRCVERWAMNVPWIGFPLAKLLERVEPTPEAKFVRFVSAERPKQMPGLRSDFQWPYHEALRIDEAMNELALVATGVYGEPLLKQHGAPVRIVVPWKYGYKNPKSIVRIELIPEQPLTFWSRPPYTHEYGFLSNVNPNIPHPRWSQAESYWLDSREKFDTPLFNGYGRYVAGLYRDEPTTPQRALRAGGTAR